MFIPPAPLPVDAPALDHTVDEPGDVHQTAVDAIDQWPRHEAIRAATNHVEAQWPADSR
ncbi:hypothetical protein [Alloactinosynnema sp. L-07]|nr:hypothetical protein [Alloactinosynnema sp. L-07]